MRAVRARPFRGRLVRSRRRLVAEGIRTLRPLLAAGGRRGAGVPPHLAAARRPCRRGVARGVRAHDFRHQANWVPHRVTQDMPVMDVSPANDWSAVRVWWPPSGQMGSRHYPTWGFILPDRPLSRDGLEASLRETLRVTSSTEPRRGHPRPEGRHGRTGLWYNWSVSDGGGYGKFADRSGVHSDGTGAGCPGYDE